MRPDDELDTSSATAQVLLREQVPALAGLPLHPLSSTGSDNVLYRVGADNVLRLPRFADAAHRLRAELDWLPRLSRLPVSVPEVVHIGTAHDRYPFEWAVLRWVDGIDGWAARRHDSWFGPELGHDLAAVVQELRLVPVADAAAREPGQRGGPIGALDGRVRWWLERADGLVDRRAVLRLWASCLDGADDGIEPVLVHGDLIPGNVLFARGRLTAVIDWGGVGAGDPALDLCPAWSMLDLEGAAAFRRDLDVDPASWLRARGFALEQAIGGVITYTPRGHPLGAVMQRTLDRLLSRSPA